ncbi:MAG TPA: urease accessory UreF family protein [Pontiella sp.]
MPLTVLQMLHLADSALPVGGFAFSNGLEAAVKCGMIASRSDLERYLEDAIRQWIAFDGPFITAFHASLCEEMLMRYDRMLLSPTMRKASFSQGRGWLRVFEQIFPGTHPSVFRSALSALSIGPHYLPLFANSLGTAGAGEQQVRELYFFTLLRDQMGAAVRLGLIGPGGAQAMQSRLEVLLHPQLMDCRDQPPRRFTPMMDIAQMLQPSLYTKLFQN